MRRSTFRGVDANENSASTGNWLNVEELATVELSSEDPLHRFEDALAERREGWKALSTGPQVVRLHFDDPQEISRIHLQFQECNQERSQEIALFVTTETAARRELVRQQWVFSPTGATSEVEDYTFELKEVVVLELEIDPGRHDKQALATLKSIRLG